MTASYTVLNRHGDVQVRGASLIEAAETVLQYDGHRYEMRKADDGFWVLYHTTRGGGGNVPMTPTVLCATTQNQIFQGVIDRANIFDHQEVMTDEAYDKMIAEIDD